MRLRVSLDHGPVQLSFFDAGSTSTPTSHPSRVGLLAVARRKRKTAKLRPQVGLHGDEFRVHRQPARLDMDMRGVRTSCPSMPQSFLARSSCRRHPTTRVTLAGWVLWSMVYLVGIGIWALAGKWPGAQLLESAAMVPQDGPHASDPARWGRGVEI